MSTILTNSLTGWDRIIHIFDCGTQRIGVSTTTLSICRATQLISVYHQSAIYRTFLQIAEYEEKVRSNQIKPCDKIIYTN